MILLFLLEICLEILVGEISLDMLWGDLFSFFVGKLVFRDCTCLRKTL